ncbi:ATP-binding protein [Streptacidiphilus neutrinimicus]|uniref:ATP-binding protein n=1 Tax=Streptacidiphilus neutrinimicus TaxID=105420 RepID=UPI0005A878C6|nr:ATP-binding protein [Streptacidiphilus neutrinimicus]
MAEVGAVGWARRFPVRGGIRAGRAWAGDHLSALGWDQSAPQIVDAVVLAVSELLTNAHVHARSDAELVLTWDGQCLHLSVHDHDPGLPRPRESGPEELGGRGLALVEAVADHWHTSPEPDGKTVTACFHPPSAVSGPLPS